MGQKSAIAAEIRVRPDLRSMHVSIARAGPLNTEMVPRRSSAFVRIILRRSASLRTKSRCSATPRNPPQRKNLWWVTKLRG
jgi:hypothetical protein